MINTTSIVAVYDSHELAEAAVKQLQEAGLNVRTISLIEKDYLTDEQIVGYYNTGDRMKYWGKLGAFWGGLWGLLFGAAFFVIPGVGPGLVAGPLVASIVAALEGAVVTGGLSAVGAGLYGLGIPKDSILKYEVGLKAGKFLLVVHSSAEDVAKARELLKTSGTSDMNIQEEAALSS